jgi:hypothetical protein
MSETTVKWKQNKNIRRWIKMQTNSKWGEWGWDNDVFFIAKSYSKIKFSNISVNRSVTEQ